MRFPKERFTFKVTQQFIFFIFYFFLFKFTSYLFHPLSDIQCFEIALFLNVLEIICVFVEFKRSNILSRAIVEVLESVRWFNLMVLFSAIALMIFNAFIFTVPVGYDMLLLLIIALLFIYGYYNAHNPKIIGRILYLDNLEDEIRIVHLSDIHIGSIRGHGLLQKIANQVNGANPDLVIISGDLADGSNTIQIDDFIEFKQIEVPVIFTPGNHDYYTGIENVFKACENADMIILDNGKLVFKGLNIYGLSFNGDFDLEVDSNENNLLIYHVPVNWDYFRNMGFDIMLSGHTHGGQFYPANFWVKAVYPKLRGLFEKDGSYLNVSDGAGTMGPPVRIGTRSEISVIKLKKR